MSCTEIILANGIIDVDILVPPLASLNLIDNSRLIQSYAVSEDILHNLIISTPVFLNLG